LGFLLLNYVDHCLLFVFFVTIDVFRLPLGIFKFFFLVWHILLVLHFEFSSICNINRLWVSIILFIIIKTNLSKVNLSFWYLLTTYLAFQFFTLSVFDAGYSRNAFVHINLDIYGFCLCLCWLPKFITASVCRLVEHCVCLILTKYNI
jgi:hypothetical protein